MLNKVVIENTIAGKITLQNKHSYLSAMRHHHYYVYILKCADGSYYTGVTNNLERRLDEHNQGLVPSCYTFTRRPVVLMYNELYQLVANAIAREKQIKRWSRKKKEALIRGDYEMLTKLASSVKGNN